MTMRLGFGMARSTQILVCFKSGDNDHNTKYFHAVTMTRRRRNTIRPLKLGNGEWCDDYVILKVEPRYFFRCLFTSESRLHCPSSPYGAFLTISGNSVNVVLTMMTKEEVRHVVFSMAP
ncbi:hypothetical protein GQ457_08G021310 [Hibiscus cannabinus]